MFCGLWTEDKLGEIWLTGRNKVSQPYLLNDMISSCYLHDVKKS